MAVTSMANSSLRDFQKKNTMNVFNNFGYPVSYVVVAGGGGGGGRSYAGGGGAGGYRSSFSGESSGGGASAQSGLVASSATYIVTVGAGRRDIPHQNKPKRTSIRKKSVRV